MRGRVAVALSSHSSILFPISCTVLVTALPLPAFQQLLKLWQQPVGLCCQKVLQAQGLILCQSPACASCRGGEGDPCSPRALRAVGRFGLSAVQHHVQLSAMSHLLCPTGSLPAGACAGSVLGAGYRLQEAPHGGGSKPGAAHGTMLLQVWLCKGGARGLAPSLGD